MHKVQSRCVHACFALQYIHRYVSPIDLIAHVACIAESAVSTAQHIKDLSEQNDPKLAKLKIALRNQYIAQVTHNRPLSKPPMKGANSNPTSSKDPESSCSNSAGSPRGPLGA